MQKQLIALLKLLEEAVPPPEKCHHALMYAQFDNDDAGLEDRLRLQVNKNGIFYSFFLDEDDFDRSPSEIVAEIVELLSGLAP